MKAQRIEPVTAQNLQTLERDVFVIRIQGPFDGFGRRSAVHKPQSQVGRSQVEVKQPLDEFVRVVVFLALPVMSNREVVGDVK